MKKFYVTTTGIDLNIFSTLTGVHTNPINMNGNGIYFYEEDKINNSQAVDQVSIFGDDAFNTLQTAISCEELISIPPLAPADKTWYLISKLATYDNIVKITMDGAITGVIAGDTIIAQNGATGVVTVVDGVTLTIKYNGTDFSETAGSEVIHEGTVFDVLTVNQASITVEDTTGPIKADLTNRLNQLAYYDSTDTANNWKYINPFTDILIILDGNGYKWNTQGTTDHRWINIPASLIAGNSTTETIAVNLAAVGSTTIVDSSMYSGGVIQYKVANINTDVTLRAEGSNDATNWFNLDASDLDTTHIANGTFAMTYNIKYKYTRLTMVSESGGTAVTIEDISFFLTN